MRPQNASPRHVIRVADGAERGGSGPARRGRSVKVHGLNWVRWSPWMIRSGPGPAAPRESMAISSAEVARSAIAFVACSVAPVPIGTVGTSCSRRGPSRHRLGVGVLPAARPARRHCGCPGDALVVSWRTSAPRRVAEAACRASWGAGVGARSSYSWSPGLRVLACSGDREDTMTYRRERSGRGYRAPTGGCRRRCGPRF
jgi:hypothetical protein